MLSPRSHRPQALAGKPGQEKLQVPHRLAPPLKRFFPFEQFARYRVLSGEMAGQTGEGRTLCMSSSSVSFTAERTLRDGAVIELSVDWPVLLNDSCPIKLVVCGRLEAGAPGTYAISVERHEFRTRATRA